MPEGDETPPLRRTNVHPVGKRYAIKIEAEKRHLEVEQIPDSTGIKISATSIVAAYADKGGQRQFMRKS